MTSPIMSESEVRGFVSNNADYYLSKWKLLLEGEDWSGFNWAAFFFAGFWLPYRKMYGAATVLYTISLLGVLSEGALPAGSDAPFACIVKCGIGIICGAFGNQWYFRHAAKEVANARAECVANDELAQVLSKRGGTSVAAAILFFLGFVMVCGLVGCLAKG